MMSLSFSWFGNVVFFGAKKKSASGFNSRTVSFS